MNTDYASNTRIQPGTLIDGREVIRCLGTGGMGSVYQTRHLQMDRLEAVKIMHPRFVADPEFFQRFKREGKSVAALNHPNVVDVYAFGVFGGVPYLAMEYLEGPSLREMLCIGGKLSEPLAVSFILDICAGLQHAHDAGIIHRDLKPDNVIVVHTDEGRKAKVVDFGLSKACVDGQRLTLTGEVVGDPRYMSPEQTQGQKLDYRSDIYSLGCLMYEVLTGTPPFQAETNVALMYMRLENEPPRFPVGVDLPPAYEAIVMRAMALDKRHRFESASALAEELTNALNDDYVPKPLARTPLPETARSQSGPSGQPGSDGLRAKFDWKQALHWRTAVLVCAVAWIVVGIAMPLIGRLSSKETAPHTPSSIDKVFGAADRNSLSKPECKSKCAGFEFYQDGYGRHS